MSSPTRFPNGVTNVAVGNVAGQYGLPDPTQWHTYFNDFDTYVAGEWTITTTEAGTGSATEALADGDGGLLLITNAAGDNDLDFLQKVGESFLLEAGKKAFFKTRIQTSDATESDIVVGLQITDTTALDVTDGVYFLKADGAATVDVFARKNATTGSTTAASVATMADATWIELAWAYNGVDEIKVYADNVHVASLDASSTYLPDSELTISFGLQNGEAVAKTLTVDYLFAAKER